jgi:serine/threonine protein kinase
MVTFVQYVLSYHLSQSFIPFQSNVLCSEGHCYLTDFCIAKMPGMATSSTFAKMVHCGWAAPELDQQPRTKQSDIFSFACTIYEVLVYLLDLSLLFTYLCAKDVYPTTPL